MFFCLFVCLFFFEIFEISVRPVLIFSLLHTNNAYLSIFRMRDSYFDLKMQTAHDTAELRMRETDEKTVALLLYELILSDYDKRVTPYLYHVNRWDTHKKIVDSKVGLCTSLRTVAVTILCVSFRFRNSATVSKLEQVQLCNRRIDQSADNITDLKCANEPVILKYK